ncbi:hypothetical protein ACIS_00722 [Anaplasma centrale str. Israel]|uniref:Uncharacterized protein n=1 Tax=Anaplasma centrale (strain Israel) TaxID=574556 RepID=D1AUQ6_ANACI|nr:hypothetical protein [Anaplasma centrale]ACZ49284.1 hypothetical protein ACIS_00722 [Anaplasma centrale str. Israel]
MMALSVLGLILGVSSVETGFITRQLNKWLTKAPQCRVGYVYNVGYDNSLNLRYSTRVGSSWDLYATSIWPAVTDRIYHEFEFRSSMATPVLEEGIVGVLRVIQQMLGDADITIREIEDMLSIRRLSISYGLYGHYPLGRKVGVYVGSSVGIAKILQYQGLRRYSEDIYGIVTQSKIGLSYLIISGLEAYVGYNYRKHHWQYKTDTIRDEDGNGVFYNFQDFAFNSYGIELGLKFSVRRSKAVVV